jgi:hypothetical protein
MSSKSQAFAGQNFSRWFVILSPLIGVLLGLVGAFLANH